MRLLGDEYIKSEFRSHREVENPVHIVCLYGKREKGEMGLGCGRRGLIMYRLVS